MITPHHAQLREQIERFDALRQATGSTDFAELIPDDPVELGYTHSFKATLSEESRIEVNAVLEFEGDFDYAEGVGVGQLTEHIRVAALG